MANLNRHAMLYTVRLGIATPPSAFGRYSVLSHILGLFFCHRNNYIALVSRSRSLCLSSNGSVCKGYRSLAKLTIFSKCVLPKRESGKSVQISSSLTILFINAG